MLSKPTRSKTPIVVQSVCIVKSGLLQQAKDVVFRVCDHQSALCVDGDAAWVMKVGIFGATVIKAEGGVPCHRRDLARRSDLSDAMVVGVDHQEVALGIEHEAVRPRKAGL